MIVHESDVLTAAPDRRLQVGRLLPVDALAAIGGPSDRRGVATMPASPGSPASPVAPAASAAGSTAPDSTPDIAARLPLGRVIDARVIDVPPPDRVVATFETLRIELAWPTANGPPPTTGSDLSLQVVAHVPTLLLQTVPTPAPGAHAGDDTLQWSDAAASLQSRAIDASMPRSRTIRFAAPLVATDMRDAAAIDAANAGTPAVDAPPVDRGAAITDEAAPRPVIGADPSDRPLAAFVPLVLQGPAWPDQPMELVVRRDRADEEFDNPALDHWCGEVTIDLPHLGRVAAHLAFSLQGLRVRIDAEPAASVDTMTDAAPALAAALVDADLRVAALAICRPARGPERADRG